MKVFLDTNILLDIIEGRENFLLPSLNVFDLGIRGEIQMYASPLTFANCVYSARKNVGYPKAIEGLLFLKKYVMAATMNDSHVMTALNSGMPDFEDMLQYEAALEAGCNVIVTRDKKRHFPKDGIPVLAPKAFLDTYFAV